MFKIDLATGTGSVLYSFTGPQDGVSPISLVPVGGQLFGVALNGGGNQDGMLFSIDPASGLETTRYTF